MEMAGFQYIILMTLSTAMSYADAALQIWHGGAAGKAQKDSFVFGFRVGIPNRSTQG